MVVLHLYYMYTINMYIWAYIFPIITLVEGDQSEHGENIVAANAGKMNFGALFVEFDFFPLLRIQPRVRL